MKLFERLAAFLSNLTGIALFSGFTAGGLLAVFVSVWAYLKKVDAILVLIILIFLLTSSTWLWIGILWLADRLKSKSASKPLLNCEWGLRVEGVALNRDASNPDAEWQMRYTIRNTRDWPLRLTTDGNELTIENHLPDSMLRIIGTQVIAGKEAIWINSHAYKKGSLPEKDKLNGTFGLTIRYGHPSEGYSRKFIVRSQFEVVLRPPNFLAAAVPSLIPQTGVFIPNVYPVDEDKDEPLL